MKKTLLLLTVMVLLSVTGLFAALVDMDFTSSVGTYNEISGGTVLGTTTSDDQNFINPDALAGATGLQTNVGFPIGFNFGYNGNMYDHFGVNNNGWIVLGTATFGIGGAGQYTPISSSTVTGFANAISALSQDLQGQTGSELSFLTQGEQPNRVCVIQWKNYKYYGTGTSGGVGDSYNFQIRLCETNNNVEIAYGPFTCNANQRAVQVGLRGADNTDYANRETVDNWSATNAGSVNTATCTLLGNIFPANGLTFTYSAPNVVIPPNPANCGSPLDAATGIAPYATLNWAGGGGLPTGYRLNFGTNNPPTNILNNQDLNLVTTYDPTPDMTYNTTYYWQVIPYNANGSAENCPIWSFTTMPDPSVTTFPFNEGFENSFPPAGWLNVHVNGATLTQIWNQAATGTSPACTPHGGGQMARFNSYSFEDESSAALITPPVTIPAAGYRVGFWMYRDDGYPTLANERVDLLHNTTPDATTATVLGTVHRVLAFDPPVTEAGWYEYQFTIPAEYTGPNHYFMLLGVSQFGNNMFVDDFYIDALPTQPVFVLNGENLDFGTVNISEVSAPLTFTMSNGGVGTVTVSSITLGGPDAAQFNTTLPATPLNINTGESVPVQVTFVPTTQGEKTATITIVEGPNNTTHVVNLSGTGHDSIILPPYSETFEGTVFPPLDWTRFSGLMEDPSVLTETTGGWTSDDFGNITDPVNKSAKLNIYGTTSKYWLVSPTISLPNSSTITLQFDIALTVWNETDSVTLGEDDKFAVIISTDNGQTWSSSNVLQLWTSETPISNTGEPVSISLGTYSGNVKIAFYGESTVSGNGDNDIFVDNFALTTGGGPVFNPPTNLTATTGIVFVDLAWNAPAPATMDVRNNGQKVQTRTLAGYKVYRNNILITPQPITTLTYHDTAVVSGTQYTYYVTAVYTNPNGESAPSNTVIVTPQGPVFNPPTNLQASVVENDDVHLTWVAPAARTNGNGPLQKAKPGSQSVRTNNVQKEEIVYNTRSLSGYKVYRNNALISTITNTSTLVYDDNNLSAGTYSYYVTAVYTNPDGESVPSNVVTVPIVAPPAQLVFEDTFETREDFAIEFAPWTLIDVDQSTTYGFEETTFPNSGVPMAYIIFNPTTTTPAITDIVPHSGNKLAACFASVTPPNNDWMIAPKMHLGTNSSLNFWARSYTAQYGLERFKVAISTTTTDPAAFTVISPAPYVSAPITWTEYTYDLNAYNGQDIYVGIQCISNDAFIFFVDDFKVYSNAGYVGNNNPEIAPINTTLGTNYPNPFNPETTLNYSLKDKGQVSIDIYNLKGQKVRTLVNEVMNSGNHKVTWNGKDNNNNTVASGVYFFNMKSGKFSSSRKVILMK